jgi:hypothetical protein
MTAKKGKLTLRTEVVRAAQEATVPVNDHDRAIILGQLAGLLAVHPKIGGKIAFKGGAIMHLVDGSPRLSRDLDGVMVAGGPIRERVVREALGTPEARKIVREVGRFSTGSEGSLRFPVIVCHPLSGIGDVTVSLSIHWDHPLLLKPDTTKVTVQGRDITLLVVARIERVAEKVRAFLDRGLDRDAFDLYQFSQNGLTPEETAQLANLVERKMHEDEEIETGVHLHERFDAHIAGLASSWGTGSSLVVTRAVPAWTDVEPKVKSFRRYVPRFKS